MKYAFPEHYGVSCRLVAIDASFVPIVAGLLTELAEPGRWVTYEDYTQAYNAIADMVASMAVDCTKELRTSVDRLYMAVRQMSVGEEFTADGEGLPPVLPVVPPVLPAGYEGGIMGRIIAMQGVKPSAWPFSPGTPVTLADVEKALRVGSESDADILDQLADGLDTVDDASDIFNTIRGFLGSMLDGTLEGGQLAVLTAMALSQSMFAGLQAQQLDALKLSIDQMSAKIAAAVPATPDATVTGELAQMREHLTPIDEEV